MNRIVWMTMLKTVTTMPEILDEEADDTTAKDVEPLPEDAFPKLTANNIHENLHKTITGQVEKTFDEPASRLSSSVSTALQQSMSFSEMSSADQEVSTFKREPALRFSTGLQEKDSDLPKPAKKRRQSIDVSYYPVVSKHYDLEKKIADWRKGLLQIHTNDLRFLLLPRLHLPT